MVVVAVIHLLPLPGAPTPSPGLDAVIARAVADADTLLSGGIDVAIIENLGDAPFQAGAVGPDVVACMTAVAVRVRDATRGRLQLGVNVLRNDARAALGVALACGARFIRVNVHTGAAWTDQGLIQGRAAETLHQRRALGLAPRADANAVRGGAWLGAGGDGEVSRGSPDRGVRIAADVHVKHASPAGDLDIADAAADLYHRGGADVVIVTGSHTGGATDLDDLRAVRARLPGAPVWVGSGVRPDVLPRIQGLADGLIVGTWLHRDSDLRAPLDPARVASLVRGLDAR